MDRKTTTPTRLDDARRSWRKAYHLACDLATAVEGLPKDHMDDAGIAKFALLIGGKTKIADGTLCIVCAAGMPQNGGC